MGGRREEKGTEVEIKVKGFEQTNHEKCHRAKRTTRQREARGRLKIPPLLMSNPK